MHHKPDNLYTPKAEKPCPYGPKARLSGPVTSTAHPVQRPLARQALCCRSESSLTMASSESVCPFQCLIFFVHCIFALRSRMGWHRQIPQFAPRIYDLVPSSVPRRSCRVHMVVSSTTVLAFAISALARQPHPIHAGSHVGCVTRLQSSLHATARSLASSSPARTFTIKLPPDGSPRSDVDYNYTANNQLPQPDFHRQDTRPYGLRAKCAKFCPNRVPAGRTRPASVRAKGPISFECNLRIVNLTLLCILSLLMTLSEKATTIC